MKLSAKEARKLIGSTVTLKCRSSIFPKKGVILEVKGRNVLIDHHGVTDWHWLPDTDISQGENHA